MWQVPQEELGCGAPASVGWWNRIWDVQQAGKHCHVDISLHSCAGLPHQQSIGTSCCQGWGKRKPLRGTTVGFFGGGAQLVLHGFPGEVAISVESTSIYLNICQESLNLLFPAWELLSPCFCLLVSFSLSPAEWTGWSRALPWITCTWCLCVWNGSLRNLKSMDASASASMMKCAT